MGTPSLSAVDVPRNLDFVIDEQHIPQDFLHADITIGTKRHLVFATERMLDLLSKAKRWNILCSS